MLKKLVVASAAFVMTASMSLFAEPVNAGWFTAKISKIQTSANGQFIVYFDAETKHECGGNRLDFSDPKAAGARMIYTALLLAQAQQKELSFNITSCSGIVGIFSDIEG
jgi:hypothetical protein